MERTMVREPKRMPAEIRLTYGKLLGLMILAQHRPEAVAMQEFYRALRKIEMKEKDRQVIFEYMMDPDQSASELIEIIMTVKDDQERNLLRFSLLEDLYRIMKADFYEDKDEKYYFDEVVSKLGIQPQHLQFVVDTYEKEDLYVPGMEKESTSDTLIRYMAGLTVGIITAGIIRKSTWKKKSENSAIEIIAVLSSSFVAFQTTQHLMKLKGTKGRWIRKKLLKEKLKQEQQLIKDIKKDHRMIRQIIKKKSSQFMATFSWQDVLTLLEKTLAYLEK